jgi:hypothetical protein
MDITQFFKPHANNSQQSNKMRMDEGNELKKMYMAQIGKFANNGIIDTHEYTKLLNFMKSGGTLVEMGVFTEIKNKITSSQFDPEFKEEFDKTVQKLFMHLYTAISSDGEINIKNIIDDMVLNDEIAISYTKGQVNAIHEIFGFLINSKEKVFGLQGYAGTGKTTLITKLIHYLLLKSYIRSVALSAPTNKAVNVMKSKFKNDISNLLKKKSANRISETATLNDQLGKLEDTGFKVNFLTIHKLLNYKNDYDVDGGRVFVRGKRSSLIDYDLIIIDECSMIPLNMIASIFEDINKNASSGRELISKRIPKILFLGDPAQLPPVNEKISIIFSKNPKDFNLELYKKSVDLITNPYAKDGSADIAKKFDSFKEGVLTMKTVVLAEVVRSNDDKVVGLCNHVREWVMGSIDSPKIGLFKGAKVKIYKLQRGEDKLESKWFKECVNFFTDEKSSISNIILAWTNDRCKSYNTRIRQIKNNKKNLNQFERGDILILKDFYDIKETEVVECQKVDGVAKETKKFYTSEQIKITDIGHVTKALSKFSEALPFQNKLPNHAFVEDKYKKTIKTINKNCGMKYDVYKLYVTKLTDGLNPNQTVDIYPIYVMKAESKTLIEEDIRKASDAINDLRKLFQATFREHLDQLDREVIIPLRRESAKRFIETFADVTQASSCTTHVSQASTYYNVFVDTDDILKNPDSDEAKRCLYTAITRTSNILSMLV